MRTPSFLMIATACLAIAGCNRAETPVQNDNEAAPTNETEDNGATSNITQASACPMVRSFDWLAEAHDVGGKKVAIVTGKVEVKSEGFTVSLAEGTPDPPVRYLTLTVTEPSQPSAAKLTVHDAELAFLIAPMGQTVSISCGGQEIHRMDVVRPLEGAQKAGG